MSMAIIGIGLPASGKTTVLKPLAERLGAAYVCPDDIRGELSGGDPTDHSRELEVWDLARGRAVQAIEGGRTLVVDATFTRPDDRCAFIELLRAAGATQIIGAYAEISKEEAHARNFSRKRTVPFHVIEDRHELLAKHPPSTADGFDAIVPLSELPERLS